MVGCVHEALWREQIDYYGRGAAEYDAGYGDPDEADARIAALVERVRPSGDVLEIAPGTGIWTEKLVRLARTVTAVDAAPEMIQQARRRLRGHDIGFVRSDVFDWVPSRRFDMVFFAFWLSHVPSVSFAPFWSLIGQWLADDGRVVFVDEQVGEAAKEVYLPDSSEIVMRHLADGSFHQIVKVFRSSADLEDALGRLGWRASVRPDGTDWLVGEARQA
jgi:2-polyprenyl-3-methyl-5-hydroxy-6-metoxy-1,4-benzoquinol methylase